MAAARANWKGYLRLSLVSCPIALYPATSESEKVRFNQLNKPEEPLIPVPLPHHAFFGNRWTRELARKSAKRSRRRRDGLDCHVGPAVLMTFSTMAANVNKM